MRLIDVDNISFEEINKALEDLSWWCNTNEQDGVVYIPSSNLIKDIGRIKDYLEYIKQQPTAFDVQKVVSELEDCKVEFELFGICSDYVEFSHIKEIVKEGGIDEYDRE